MSSEKWFHSFHEYGIDKRIYLIPVCKKSKIIINQPVGENNYKDPSEKNRKEKKKEKKKKNRWKKVTNING